MKSVGVKPIRGQDIMESHKGKIILTYLKKKKNEMRYVQKKNKKERPMKGSNNEAGHEGDKAERSREADIREEQQELSPREQFFKINGYYPQRYSSSERYDNLMFGGEY